MGRIPPYSVDGKSLKSVTGLCNHLVKKHQADGVGAITDRRLKVFRGNDVVALYSVEYKPEAIVLTEAA
jgi:hypothetical protein